MYLVEQSLTAFSTTDLLKIRDHRFREKFDHPQIRTRLEQTPDFKDLPISQDGKIVPGRLYPTSHEPGSIRYYLPLYQHHIAGGKFTTSLKWRSPQDPPDGPLAWLTLQLSPQVPSGSENYTLKEIEHEAAVRLSYSLPVKSDEEKSTSLDRWVGTWENIDANTRGMTRVKIIKTANQKLTLHGFGKCHPRDCDWGVTSTTVTSKTLSATYDVGWKKTHINLTPSNHLLIADVHSDYSEQDGRKDRRSRYMLRRKGQPTPASSKLWIELGALEKLPSGVRQCRGAIHSKAEFDRIYQLMTDRRFNAALEIQCLSMVGFRSWQQIFLRRARLRNKTKALRENQVLFTDTADYTSLKVANENRRQQRVKLDKTLDRSQLIRHLQQNKSSVVNKHRVRSLKANSTNVHLAKVKDLYRVDGLLKAEPLPIQTIGQALQNSDLKLTVDGRQAQAIPTNAAVNVLGKPALLRVPTETKQVLTFFFSPEDHDYMFDRRADGSPPTASVLVKQSVIGREGGIIGTVWQDLGFADQFYYEPEEFRLGRRSQSTDEGPYQPDLVIALYEAVLRTGNESSANISYRAELAYQAQPYINPKVLEQARAQLAKPGTQPKFTALNPVTSRLTLQLALDQDSEKFQPLERPDVDVSFDQGITDEVPLSSIQLERIIAAFQSPTGVGLSGHVEAKLLDGNLAKIPVNLSLLETASPLFDSTFHGPVVGERGLYELSLRNRIESPVYIDGIDAIALSDQATAYPQTPPGIQVKPGEVITLQYRVEPADTAVQQLGPTLTTRIQPQASDPEFWRHFMVNEGYTDETFEVTVSVLPVYFESTPPGMQPLTGIHVAFDSGAEIILTPEALSQQVELRMPLLPRLTNDIKAKQYRYQVTNLHGDELGAETDWLFSDQGELPLAIEPAQ